MHAACRMRYLSPRFGLKMATSHIERPEYLQNRVYTRLKNQIINGIFRPKERLIESHLAKDLGVSRTPVHNAITQLEQEGLVDNIPGKGYFVCSLSARDLQELYEIRRILEPYVVKKTVGLFTQEELKQLQGVLQTGDEALKKGNYVTFLQANRIFHHSFDKKYGNHHISRVLSDLDDQIRRFLSVRFKIHQNTLQVSQQEHWRILEAVKKEDIDSAVSLVIEHLTWVVDILLSDEEVVKAGEDG
jgi:DNA-binding GntR family transcriptional regulator